MFWTNTEIVKSVEQNRIKIAPFSMHCVKTHSYVLRLGSTWNITDNETLNFSELDPLCLEKFRKNLVKKESNSVSIKSLTFSLNASHEIISLPPDVMGILSPLGQLTRMGIVNFSSFYLHPGFGANSGIPIIFEFFHILPCKIRLYAGMPFAHLHFTSIDNYSDIKDSPALDYLRRNCLGSIYDKFDNYRKAMEEARLDNMKCKDYNHEPS
jgi:deoxycytidine triphosphate deaminase